ncbi:MAG: hypothetical protein ACFFD4_22140, partial [Candidatus Odinarchaeota archaeon]
SSIEETGHNGRKKWEVKISDKDKAETELWRILHSAKDIRITSFQQKSYELEDIFLALVEE